MSAPSRSADNRHALLCLMSDGRWRPGSTLRGVGGDRFAARLHELRTLGVVEYECRRIPGGADNAFEYRLRVDLPAPLPKPKRLGTATAVIRAQAAEIERLKERVAELELEACERLGAAS